MLVDATIALKQEHNAWLPEASSWETHYFQPQIRQNIVMGKKKVYLLISSGILVPKQHPTVIVEHYMMWCLLYYIVSGQRKIIQSNCRELLRKKCDINQEAFPCSTKRSEENMKGLSLPGLE